MRHFDENAGKYSVGAIVLMVIAALLQLNVFAVKSDLYRDFVTKADYNESQNKIDAKLDYLIKRVDEMRK